VRKRTLSMEVMESLVKRGDFSAGTEGDLLLAWSSMPLLRIETPAPYNAWIAYNFFQQSAIAVVAGRRFDGSEMGPEATSDRWIHPVHRLVENWFEEWFLTGSQRRGA
jgi:hypothetical protein